MVLAEQSLDLETLANMGVTADKSGGRYRIGKDSASSMGGRWLTKEEEESLPATIRGYKILPEGLKQGLYKKPELYHIAMETGKNGIPDYSNDLRDVMEKVYKVIKNEQKLLVSDAKALVIDDPKVAVASAIKADQVGKMAEDLRPYMWMGIEKAVYAKA